MVLLFAEDNTIGDKLLVFVSGALLYSQNTIPQPVDTVNSVLIQLTEEDYLKMKNSIPIQDNFLRLCFFLYGIFVLAFSEAILI